MPLDAPVTTANLFSWVPIPLLLSFGRAASPQTPAVRVGCARLPGPGRPLTAGQEGGGRAPAAVFARAARGTDSSRGLTNEGERMAKTAREIMSDDCTCVGENDSALDAAKRFAELGVGALPICGDDD